MAELEMRSNSSVAPLTGIMRLRFLRWLGQHPEIWVALLLVLGSHVFALSFAKFARWQFGYAYHRVADFCGWDCAWFRMVVDEGYDTAPHRQGGIKANWVDFPLFPLSAKPLKALRFRSTASALIYAGKIELYASIVFFLWLLREQLANLSEYFIAGALVAFNPYLIYAHAGYSEPLYFALATLAFWLLAHERWLLSGSAGALLSATRMIGCLFTLAYLFAYVRKFGIARLLRKRDLSVILGLLLCPLGMVVYSLYLYRHTGDALGFLHIQIAWNRVVGNPFSVLVRSLQQHGWIRLWGLTALAGLLASAWLFVVRRPELGVFLAGAVLVPLCADVWCMPRYVWWQPPFLYVLFTVLKRNRSLWFLYAAFAGGMASFMVVLWFSGSAVVI